MPAGCQTFDKIGGDRLPACGVALQRLIAAPEQFSHMRVRTYGYISYSNHHAAALYPAEDLVGRVDPYTCVEIPLSGGARIEWDGQQPASGIYFSRVTGTFATKAAEGTCAARIDGASITDLSLVARP